MRKKRNDIPKYGMKRGSEGKDATRDGCTTDRDTHHNSMTPCSNLVWRIACDILPSIIIDDTNENASLYCDSLSCDPSSRSDSSSIYGKQDKKSAFNKTITSSVANAHGNTSEPQPQSLLGSMIQKYLIHERITTRMQQNGRTATVPNINDQNTPASKKKKKKKRKKKITSSNDEGPDYQDNDEDHVCGKLALSDEVNEPNSTSFCESNASITTPPSRDSNLDCFLDSIVDSKYSIGIMDDTRGNRDLDSFTAFLSRKYELHTKQRRLDIHTSRDNPHHFNNSNILETEEAVLRYILPTVSLTELQSHACDCVDCRHCRNSAKAHLRYLTDDSDPVMMNHQWGFFNKKEHHSGGVLVLDENSISLKRRSPRLDISIPISGVMDENGERAFDYIAMTDDLDLETGTTAGTGTGVGSDHASFHLEFFPTKAGDLRIITSDDVNSKRADEEKFPLTAHDIIGLIKRVILPCGVTFKGGPYDDALSDAAFKIVVEKTRGSCGLACQKFDDINDILHQIQDKSAEAQVSNNRTQFDPTTTKLLNSCDDLCELILKQIGEYLIRITKLTCFVGWSHEYGKYLMERMVECWDQYNLTLNKLLDPTMKYRGSILQQCTRPGQVPLTYSNAMIRNSFLEYMIVKIAYIEKLVEFLDKTIIDPGQKSYRGRVHQCPSPLARLCVLEAFLSHNSEGSPDGVFPHVDDEDEFKKLLAARITLSQNVIRSPTRENINMKMRQNYNTMIELYSSIVEIVNTKLVELERATPPEFIREVHDRYAAARGKVQQEQIDNGEVTPELALSLLNNSCLLEMQWIYLLCIRQSYLSIQFVLPSRLDNWLESISGSQIKVIEPTEDESAERCDGNGGERRISSVLAALLYRWLESRCSEWHAELIRDELLHTVEVETLSAVQEANKTGKKKKTKRKAGSVGKPKPSEAVGHSYVEGGEIFINESEMKFDSSDFVGENSSVGNPHISRAEMTPEQAELDYPASTSIVEDGESAVDRTDHTKHMTNEPIPVKPLEVAASSIASNLTATSHIDADLTDELNSYPEPPTHDNKKKAKHKTGVDKLILGDIRVEIVIDTNEQEFRQLDMSAVSKVENGGSAEPSQTAGLNELTEPPCIPVDLGTAVNDSSRLPSSVQPPITLIATKDAESKDGRDKSNGPIVGVVCDGRILSAESYLVTRMEVLLTEIKGYKSRVTIWM